MAWFFTSQKDHKLKKKYGKSINYGNILKTFRKSIHVKGEKYSDIVAKYVHWDKESDEGTKYRYVEYLNY